MLAEENYSEWGTPYFPQSKAKTNCVGFLSEFWNLNRQLKHRPYPMTKICEIILKREEFKYSTPIDLDMVYYNINISEEAIKQCNIILPCRKYQYKRLPMGFSDSLEMFLEKMNEMFSGFEFI